MKKEVLDYAVAKAHELMQAHSVSAAAKEAAAVWLKAVGTAEEAAATKKFIADMEASIATIDELLALTQSDAGVKLFGEKHNAMLLEHAKKIQAEGAEYCDCPACAAVLAILKKKEEMLA